MDAQSIECLFGSDEINNQSREQSDSMSEDEVVVNTLNMEVEKGDDLPGTTESQSSQDVEGKVPMVGMVFESDNHAYEFYNSYAKSVGFSIRKQNATRHKVDKRILKRVICCSSEGLRHDHPRGPPKKGRRPTRTNCNARIVIKLLKNWNYVIIDFTKEHNHDLVPPSKVHMLRSHRRRPDAHVELIESMDRAGMRSTSIFSCTNLETVGSQNLNLLPPDCNNNEQTRPNQTLKKGDAQALLDYFKRMQSKDPFFFYSLQMDEDNQICSCFWCDGKSRMDYSFFGDVVCFNVSYKTIGSNFSFALISGVNNHGNPILFGGGLLLDESSTSFLWLFETFSTATHGKHPKTIFTNHASLMSEAITQVFPNTHHRICLWNIYQNALKHLSVLFDGFTSFATDFKNFIYNNETEEEFQSSWDILLAKYNLMGNGWLQDLYQMREKWSQAYGRDKFCAGVTTSERSEDINIYFTKYFKINLSLQEFITEYEKALSDQRGKERAENCNSMQTKPNLLTEWAAEKRAAEVYTGNIFSFFQKEYLGCMDLFLQHDGDNGTMYTYNVSSYRGCRARTVTFDSSNNTVKCSCKKFEFNGILCAHALKVLHSRELSDLPLQCYLKRWTRDATIGVVLEDHSKTDQVDNTSSSMLRYNELVHLTQVIAMKSASTEKSSAFVKRELTRMLEEVDQYVKMEPDQVRGFEDIISGSHVSMGEKSVKNKKGSERIKDQLQRPRDTGIPFTVPVIPSIPMIPFPLARPSNMPYYTQGSAGVAGVWGQPFWHGCVLPPLGSNGLPKIPLMPYIKEPVKHVDQGKSDNGTNPS